MAPHPSIAADHLDAIVAAVASVPDSIKIGAKFVLAWPLAYHAVNGVKQLMWDCGLGMGSRRVIRGVARVVAAGSFVGAVVLACL